MLKLIGSFALAAIAGFGLACVLAATPRIVNPVYQVQVITYDGNLYIAGEGDTCRSAWTNSRVPAGWQEVICRRAR